MEERYPTQQKIWTCPKCESTEYSEDTVTMTDKNLVKIYEYTE